MSNLRKTILITAFLFSLSRTYAQNNHDYFFEDVGWSVTLPLDFTLYDFIDNARNMQGGYDNYEDNYDQNPELFSSQTMIIAIKDRFNYFNISISPFDTEEDGSWEKATQAMKEQAYKTMLKMVDAERIDTCSTTEYIDGIAFNKFHIAAVVNKEVQLDMFLLSRLYNGYDFGISYLSLNEEARKQIELMLKSSRFYK